MVYYLYLCNVIRQANNLTLDNMKILKRSQTTEVTTKRTIYFDIEINNVVYNRIEIVNIHLPYLGSQIPLPTHKILWREYIDIQTVKDVSKKDVIKLGLEVAFNLHSLHNIFEY